MNLFQRMARLLGRGVDNTAAGQQALPAQLPASPAPEVATAPPAPTPAPTPKPTPNGVTRLLRLGDVARHFDVTDKTIDNWIAAGKFPKGRKLPGGRAWTEDELNQFINSKAPPAVNKSILAAIKAGLLPPEALTANFGKKPAARKPKKASPPTEHVGDVPASLAALNAVVSELAGISHPLAKSVLIRHGAKTVKTSTSQLRPEVYRSVIADCEQELARLEAQRLTRKRRQESTPKPTAAAAEPASTTLDPELVRLNDAHRRLISKHGRAAADEVLAKHGARLRWSYGLKRDQLAAVLQDMEAAIENPVSDAPATDPAQVPPGMPTPSEAAQLVVVARGQTGASVDLEKT